jgi:hypothetical protein
MPACKQPHSVDSKGLLQQGLEKSAARAAASAALSKRRNWPGAFL